VEDQRAYGCLMSIKGSYGKKILPDNHLIPSLPIAQHLLIMNKKAKDPAISASKGEGSIPLQLSKRSPKPAIAGALQLRLEP